MFKCACGEEKIIHGSAVISGNTKSCGCLSVEARKSRRLGLNHSEVTAIILGYKRHAIDRGFLWKLTRDEVLLIIFKNCFYCGSTPNNLKKTKNSLSSGLKYSGIDRVDSKQDYKYENVVPCCKVCNYAKSDMSLSEFKVWAIRIGNKAMADQWG
ncbi:MAG: hypothetical protein KAJ63_02865 [Methyloprofundus sp.]|nr:hypothetical protein [Methyloprofundus sp.]